VFEGVVAMCIAAGLVGGEAFSVDASLIQGRCGQEEASSWRPADRLAEGETGIPRGSRVSPLLSMPLAAMRKMAIETTVIRTAVVAASAGRHRLRGHLQTLPGPNGMFAQPKANIGVIEQQDCSMLDWTSAANGALLVMPEAP
jgi:hypothetical protein